MKEGLVYRAGLVVRLALLFAAGAEAGIARYYVLVTSATVASLVNYLRVGVSPVWEKAEGTH